MAVGDIVWPEMAPVLGVKLGVANARIKNNERNDVLLMQLDSGSNVVGVFTQNDFCAEPVKICQQHMQESCSTYLLVNSGNANACTGDAGWQAALECCEAVALHAGSPVSAVLPFSTGVIGELLPSEKIVNVIPDAFKALSEQNWRPAAEAIMTTDTHAKGASVSLEIGGQQCVVTGIAKGAGMINPQMATMLAFVATDAKVDTSVLQIMCKRAADASFNRITIDGDTSTNDACMLIATGARASVHIDRIDSKEYEKLEQAVMDVFERLAKLIVRDGEGATKFVEVRVKGGAFSEECFQVAYEIAHSPLVKTAMFASDANWGRIVAAVGNAGLESLDPALVKVWLNDVLIVENGGRAESYTEEAGQNEVSKPEFVVTVDLGRGRAEQSIWTTDLSHDYVKINAEYRT